jgi:hypothetical protein
MDVEGVPPGMTGTPIEGLPPGMTGTPIGGGDGGVQGVPPGMTGTPVQGVPPGMTGTPIGGSTPPAPPKTFRQQLGENLNDLWHGTGAGSYDPTSQLAIGTVKAAMSGAGGLMKIVNDHFKGAEPSDVIEYKEHNPGSTDDDALQAVQKGYRGPTSVMANAKMAARADWLLKNSESNGFFQGVGGIGENIAEIVGLTAAGDPEMAAGPASELMAEGSKVWKMMEGNTLASRLARVGWAAVKNAGEQFAQTYLHTGGDTGQATTSAMIAAPLGAAGQGIGEGIGATKQFLGKAAEEVQPIERELGPSIPRGEVEPGAGPAPSLGGAKFLQLASELRDEHGNPTAPERASQIDISEHPEIMRDRQAAFKQLNTNLAKQGLGQAVDDTNEAVSGAGVGANISPTKAGGEWRYIPPDGSTSLTAPEARSAMNTIKDEWLSRDTTPEEDSKFAQAYDDIKNQVARNDTFVASQPFQLHDRQALQAGTESWGDAASNMQTLANAKMQQAGLSQEYGLLVKARDDAQDKFTKALNNPDPEDFNARFEAQQALKDSTKKLSAYIQQKGTQPELDKVILQRAEEEQKTSDAFQAVQNMVNKHLTLTDPTARGIQEGGFTRPQEMRRFGSISDDVEEIRKEYGDVLNPLIGEHGLDHITELGDLIQNPNSSPRVKGLLDTMVSVFKQQRYGGRYAGLGAGGGWALAHLAGHTLLGGGFAAGVGVLGTRALYMNALRRMATNPAVAEAFIAAAKSTKPISVLGPRLARLLAVSGAHAASEALPSPTLQAGQNAQ